MALPVYDHIVIVMEENTAYSLVNGSANAPYMNQLAANGALFTDSHGGIPGQPNGGHPSFPNYMVFFSGSVQGSAKFATGGDACPPSGQPFAAANLYSELNAVGKTYKTYAESLPTNIHSGDAAPYYGHHNPSPWFSNVPSSATVNFSTFPTTPAGYATLPTVSFVVPNGNNDVHDGTLATADTWINTHLSGYANWAVNNNSLFIVTFDEDYTSGTNHVFTVFYGANVKKGQYSETIYHFNILRTICDMYGAASPGQAATATPITDAFTTPSNPVFPSIQLLQRVADGTEGSSFTVTASAPAVFDAAITTITGENPVSYDDPQPSVSGVINTSSTTVAVPGVTTTTSGDILVWYGFSSAPAQGAGTTSVPPPITLPTGFTRGAAQVNSTGVNIQNTGIVGGYKTQATAGPTGNENGSITAAQVNGGLLVAITASGNSNNMVGPASNIIVDSNNLDTPLSLLVSPQGTAANIVVSAPAGVASIVGGLALSGIPSLITVTAPPGFTAIPITHDSNVLEVFWDTNITSSVQLQSQFAVVAVGTSTAMAMAWNTDLLVKALDSTLWNTLDSVVSQEGVSWETITRFSSKKAIKFNVNSRTIVSQKAVAFNTKKRVTASSPVAWNLNKRIKTAKRRILWGVGIRNSAIHQELFNTGALHVSPTKAMAWAVHEKVSAMLSSDWVLVSRPKARKRVTWNLKAAVVDQKTIRFFCRKRVTSSLASSWTLKQRINSKKRVLWNALARIFDR